MKKGKWFVVRECVKCGEDLTEKERMNNDGVCPFCGYMSRVSPSMCETYSAVVRKVTPVPWKFWDFYFEEKITDR